MLSVVQVSCVSKFVDYWLYDLSCSEDAGCLDFFWHPHETEQTEHPQDVLDTKCLYLGR